MTLGWADEFYSPGKVWTTLFFPQCVFLLYALLAIFHNVLPGRATRWFDVALAIANATFYFGISYAMLSDAGFDHTTPPPQALLVSIFFTGLFYDLALECRRPSAQVQLCGRSGDVSDRRGGDSA